MKLFENKVGRPTNEVKKKRKIFTASIIIIFVVIVFAGCYALKNVSLSNLEGDANKIYSKTTQQKAVLAVAKAYLNQGAQLQYDSYRKNLNCTPEDATSKHTCYTVCSGFTYMVYKQALNMELPINTKGLLNKEDAKLGDVIIKAEVIYPKDGVSSRSEFKKFMKSDKKLSTVKPGDILAWSGHVMLVESVDLKKNTIKVIHATGVSSKDKTKADGDSGRYDTENQKELPEGDGAVHRKTITVNNIKNTDDIAIIRYITKENEITSAVKTRLKYDDIEVAKIIENVENQDYTTANKKLTYQIRIRNNSKETYENITVKENIDTSLVELTGINLNTKYVDSSIKKKLSSKKTEDVKVISWKIPEIKPGKYVTLQYTVKVKSDVNSGDIIKSTGTVGNIATSKIETRFGNTLTSEETKKLKECFDNYKTCFTKYKNENNIEKINLTSGKKFVDTLYKASLGIDLDILNVSNITKLFIYSDKKINLADSMKKYLYGNFYGLRIKDYSINDDQKDLQIAFYDSSDETARANAAWSDKTESELSERARTINSSMLKDGDVILTQKTHESKLKVYIYLNKKLHRYIKENDKASFEIIKGNKLDVFLDDLVGDYYIILRPYK